MIPGAHETLADAVVDVGRDPAPIELLQLDRASGKAFQLGLPVDEPVVEDGVLDDAREQARHIAQSLHVLVSEVAWPAGVHVEGPDDTVRPQQRDRDERVVFLATKGGDVAVTRVLPLVLHESHAPALSYPPRNALADRQSHVADHGFEVHRRSAQQHDFGGVPIDDVDETGICRRDGHDKLGHAA